MVLSNLLLLLPILYNSVTYAANDWTKPCFEGECSYDLYAPNGMSATLKVWGSPDTISDITAAAGWTVLDCKKDSLKQDIRLVCNSDGVDGAGCAHLDEHFGAVGKIVRLPEGCCRSAFARVTKEWVPQDQSIPPNLAKRITRRAGLEPEVRALSVDVNFSAVDPAQTGFVYFTIKGSTFPTVNGSLGPTAIPTQPGSLSFVQDTFDQFNKSVTGSLPFINIDRTFPLFSQSITCPIAGDTLSFNTSIQAQGAVKARAAIGVGIAAAGTLIPARLTEFGLYAGMDSEMNGSFKLTGDTNSKINTGRLKLYEVGVPGLDFPGIMSVGPVFKLFSQVAVELDIGMDMEVGLSYKTNAAKLFFPSSNYKSRGSFSPENGPLKLSVTPTRASNATVSVHLIPRVAFGVSALGGMAKAEMFLDLDTSASVAIALNANTATSPPAGNSTTSYGIDGCVHADGALGVNIGTEGTLLGLLRDTDQVNVFSKGFDLFQKCYGTQAQKDVGPRVPPSTLSGEHSFKCPSIQLPSALDKIIA